MDDANVRSNVSNYQTLSESELIATTKDTNERDVDEAMLSMNGKTRHIDDTISILT